METRRSKSEWLMEAHAWFDGLPAYLQVLIGITLIVTLFTTFAFGERTYNHGSRVLSVALVIVSVFSAALLVTLTGK
jgi:hypothetical protein